MIEVAGLVVSAALAHVATNLDNLVIMVGLILTIGRLRTVTSYIVAQVIVFAAAYYVSEGLETELPMKIGYLGVIPIALGVVALLRRSPSTASVEEKPLGQTHFIAVLVLFLSVSFDTFAVFTPLLADTRQVFFMPVLIGAAVSTLMLALSGALLAEFAPNRVDRLGRLEWLAPYVMIAIGLYVVFNTSTDAV
ncbi:hypothetical protein NBRC116594_33660 [Shimia sp. NS0008-38b]|uniref:cadmium resistance transporter n=1 Tax=Shimia sp. NS0008-38b TaxID=3127653 RepID=UPI00310AB90E